MNTSNQKPTLGKRTMQIFMQKILTLVLIVIFGFPSHSEAAMGGGGENNLPDAPFDMPPFGSIHVASIDVQPGMYAVWYFVRSEDSLTWPHYDKTITRGWAEYYRPFNSLTCTFVGDEITIQRWWYVTPDGTNADNGGWWQNGGTPFGALANGSAVEAALAAGFTCCISPKTCPSSPVPFPSSGGCPGCCGPGGTGPSDGPSGPSGPGGPGGGGPFGSGSGPSSSPNGPSFSGSPSDFRFSNGSVIDNLQLNHIHIATDYTAPSNDSASQGCVSCGAGSLTAGDLGGLLLKRIHRYQNLDQHGSFGPGVFGNFDVSLTLFGEGIAQSFLIRWRWRVINWSIAATPDCMSKRKMR